MNNKPVITVVGRLSEDSVMRFTPKAEPVTNFSIMLYTGGSKAKGYTPSLFVKINCWGELAEQCQTLTKGTSIYAEGTPKPKRMYTNKDGVEVQADLEITANKIEVVGRTSTDEETERQVEAHSHGSPDVDF